MSITRLHGSAAAVALAAAAGVTLAAVSGGAFAQEDAAAPSRASEVGAIPEARPLSEALTPQQIAAIRAAEAAAAAQAASEADAEAAALAAAEAEEAAAQEEESQEEEPTLAAQRAPSLTGFGGGAVNQEPERRFDLTLSQGFAFDSNAEASDSSDSIVSATTNARLMYTAITRDSALNIGLAAGFRALGGDGTDRNLVPLPDLSLRYSKSVNSTTSFALSFSAGLDQVAFTESAAVTPIFDASGALIGAVLTEGEDGDALKLALGAGMSLSHAINARNQVSLGLNASRSDYIDENSPVLSASTSGSLSLSWSHQSEPTLSHSLSFVTSYSQTDDAAEQTSMTFALTGGANWAVNPRMSLQGSLGPSLTFSERTVGGTAERFTSPGVRALAGLTYSGARSEIGASFSNSVTPDSDGAGIANVTAFSLGGRLQLDEFSSVGANASLAWQTPLSGDDASTQESLTAQTGLNLSTRLFDEVNASVGYRLSWSDDDGGSDVSHRVSLTFSRGFTFLP